MPDFAVPKGANAYVISSSQGARPVTLDRVRYGMQIVWAEREQSRHSHVAHPLRRISGGFSVRTVWTKHSDFEQFCNWVTWYMATSAGMDSTPAPLRVICPPAGLDLYGIPDGQSSSVPYGDAVGRTSYTYEITFLSARNPQEFESPLGADQASKFQKARNPENDPSIPYFTPGDTQMSGKQYGSDVRYDGVNTATSALRAGGVYEPEPLQRAGRAF